MSRFRILLLAAATTAGVLVPAMPAFADGTSYTWVGDGETSAWTDAGNWSPTGVPGAGDSALVEAPSDAVCHVHVTDVPAGLQLADFTMDELLYQGNPNSPCLSSIAGGSLTVTHQLTFHAGTIYTPVTIAAGASATVTPGAAVDTTQFAGGLTDQGSVTLANNTGDEYLSLTGGPGITVASGASLTTQGDNEVSADCCNSPAHVTNQGTLNVGVGTLRLDSVELDQDALLSAPAGAQVITDFAPQTAGPGARYKGAGSWNMQFGTITVTGTQTLSSGFGWILGGHGSTSEEYLEGRFSLGGTGTFEWAGGDIHAAMTLGHGIAAVADGPAGADPRDLSGLDETTMPPTPLALTVHGTLAFRNGAAYHGDSGSSLVVASDGQLTLGDGSAFGADCCNAPSSIVDSGGSVAVPAGTATLGSIGYRATGGTTTIGTGATLALSGGAPGLLSGTAVTGGGTLATAQPMTLAATTTIGTATTVSVQTGASLVSSGNAVASVAGPGSVAWTGGAIGGKVSIAASTQVSGAATKQVLVPAGKPSASVTFTGTTTVASAPAAHPNAVQTDAGATLTFAGTTTFGGNVEFRGGKVVTTGATTVRAGTAATYFNANSAYTNSGALTVTTGTLRADNDIVQTAGSTTLAGGTTAELVGSSSVLRLLGGTLSGTGTVTGALTNTAGTVAPGGTSIGTLTVTKAYTSAKGATLALDVSATSSDVLAVGGAATVAGTLVANDFGGYVPTTGASATVVTGSSVVKKALCVQTVGTTAQHWTVRVVGGTSLVLRSVDGEAPPC